MIKMIKKCKTSEELELLIHYDMQDDQLKHVWNELVCVNKTNYLIMNAVADWTKELQNTKSYITADFKKIVSAKLDKMHGL